MANVSTGYGTVTIYAKELEDIAQLVYLQYLSEKNCYYNTTLTEIEDLAPILDDKTKTIEEKLKAIYEILSTDSIYIDEKYPISATFDLTFSGRWTFNNNIDWFFKETFKLNDNHSHNDEINQFIDEVKQKEFCVRFEFSEEEPGIGFIQKGDVLIQWDGREQTIESEEYQEYEYSVENLIRFGLYNAGDIWDTDYIIENPNVLKNELETGIMNDQYQDLIDIAENFDLFITFLKDNQKELDTGVYWEIKEWYEESFYIADLNTEWSKFLETKTKK